MKNTQMFYYTVESSHWPNDLEFKSKLTLTEGQCFRILNHDGKHVYPTRFKVRRVSETPRYMGTHVEIKGVDLNVEPF